MSRGDKPVIIRTELDPPEGKPAPDKILMVHPGKGYRWVRSDQRERKAKFGFEFVREYSPNDEITGTVNLSGLSKAELMEKARMLQEIAGAEPDKPKEQTKAEKAYAAKMAKDKAVKAQMEARAAGIAGKGAK